MARRGLVARWTPWARLVAAAALAAAVIAAGAWWLAPPVVLAAVLTAFLPHLLRGWRTVGRFTAAERAARHARAAIAAAPAGAPGTLLAMRAYRDAVAAEDDDLARLAGMRQAAQLARSATRQVTAAGDPLG
jgi:hypothetical protein